MACTNWTEANPKNANCTVSQALINYLIRDDFSSLYTVFQQGCYDSRLYSPRCSTTEQSALEQIASGMEAVGVLKLVRVFPREFEQFFTNNSLEDVTAVYMLSLFRFPEDKNDSQKKTADMLKQFINTSTTDGNTTLCKLLEPFREYLVLI